MQAGPRPLNKLPPQNAQKVMRLAERWNRASSAQRQWAESARTCVDFVENRQYTDDQLKAAKAMGRPALTFNIVAPLIRMIAGYQANNRAEIKYLPGTDGTGTQEVAEVLNMISKQIDELNGAKFVGADVFLDGLTTGRGFFDQRIDFSRNWLGEVKVTAKDPFSIYLDPDGNTYDLNESCAYVIESRHVSIDELDMVNREVARRAAMLVGGNTPVANMVTQHFDDEVKPPTDFGLKDGAWSSQWWDNFYAQMGDLVDPARKTIRMIECQYQVLKEARVLIDVETGDSKVLPDTVDENAVRKMLWYAEQKQNPLRLETMLVRSYRWLTTIGDLIVHDGESPYNSYTYTMYAPLFRRGMTRSIVEDMLDAQREKNKRRSAEIDIVTKSANSGWIWEDGALDPFEEKKLRTIGAMPGLNLKFQPGRQPPQRIQPGQPPMAMERLERAADEDIRRISGINESALGITDNAKSGRAIEARQRQATVSIQMYIDKWQRSLELLGKQRLDLVQNWYTEERMIRIRGENGAYQQFNINQQILDPINNTVAEIRNNITLGKYLVAVDETNISATFQNAQFEEALELVKSMGIPGIAVADIIVDLSLIPRKDEFKQRVQQLVQQQGLMPVVGPAGSGPAMMPGGPGALPGVPGMAPGAPAASPQMMPQPGAAPAAGAQIVPMPQRPQA